MDEIEAAEAQRQERAAEMQASETPRLSPVSRVDTPGASSMRLVPASALPSFRAAQSLRPVRMLIVVLRAAPLQDEGEVHERPPLDSTLTQMLEDTDEEDEEPEDK